MNKWKKRVRGIRSLIESWMNLQIDPEGEPVRRGRFVAAG